MSTANTIIQNAIETTILFVDDEPNILSSLKRLFRGTAYRVLCAGGGKEGLDILEKENVDLVVSDARMPEMDGATFLKEVYLRWPHITRIMLTGYADLTTTISAINDAKIFRYISKPWEDDDLRSTIDGALRFQFLEREQERLEQLTRVQNEQLTDMNANLEKKVIARTAELQQTADMLDAAYDELHASYESSVRVFASLIQLRKGLSPKSHQRIIELCRSMCKTLQVSDSDSRDIEMAASLYNIGKMAWSDELLEKPYAILSKEELEDVHRYPATSESILLPLSPLSECAKIIRHHQERFDGNGFPDGLSGTRIPYGSRLLKLVLDFEGLQTKKLFASSMTVQQAMDYVRSHIGIIYDPDIAELLLHMFSKSEQKPTHEAERTLGVAALRTGMILSRDLYTQDGILLLNHGTLLTEPYIERIQTFQNADKVNYAVHVKLMST